MAEPGPWAWSNSFTVWVRIFIGGSPSNIMNVLPPAPRREGRRKGGLCHPVYLAVWPTPMAPQPPNTTPALRAHTILALNLYPTITNKKHIAQEQPRFIRPIGDFDCTKKCLKLNT